MKRKVKNAKKKTESKTIATLSSKIDRGFRETRGEIHGVRGEIHEVREEMRDGFHKANVAIEELARATQLGFEETVTKSEFKKETGEIKEDVSFVNNRLDAIETQLIDIRKQLENIIYRHEFELLKDRLTSVERELAQVKRRSR